MSVGSEATNQQGVDDSSNDALVIVDDAHSGFPPGQSPPHSASLVCLLLKRSHEHTVQYILLMQTVFKIPVII